ncbi:unnamed protein product [Paramecium pentaurelia]|uniref:Rho GDP-dissociation inhibitor n=1 Tax=Paramecium pentaurelia TaxID=43138 RepID=A0A8S1WVL5_9CILI|nr:unnamed protein product [Paramecium pentaurelia]
MKQNDPLPQSQVRQRQQSCTVDKLSENDLKDFHLDNLNFNKQRVSLAVICSQNQQDESLVKYQKAILENIDELKDEAPEVEFFLMEVLFPNKPERSIALDLQFGMKENEKTPFKIKEGEEYHIRLHFKVKNDCVIGLKLYNTIRRHGIKVDSYEEIIGSFAPKKHIQIYDMESQIAPSGFLARGHYKGKLLFADGDGIVHMQFDYYFEISKDW